MPMTVLQNPIYRKEFMLKFGEHVQHIMDCPETSRPERSRNKGFVHTARVKQICPLTIPVTEAELADYNQANRDQFDAELTKASNNKLKHVHAKLGLAWDMYPKKDAKFDTLGVIESTAKQAMDRQNLCNMTRVTAL